MRRNIALKRIYANVVDLMYIFLVTCTVSYMFEVEEILPEELNKYIFKASFFILLIFKDVYRGQSLGKYFLNLIVKEEEAGFQSLTIRKTIIRNIPLLLPFVIFIVLFQIIILLPQRVGDAYANCVVDINSNKNKSYKTVAMILFLHIAIVLAIYFVSIISLLLYSTAQEDRFEEYVFNERNFAISIPYNASNFVGTHTRSQEKIANTYTYESEYNGLVFRVSIYMTEHSTNIKDSLNLINIGENDSLVITKSYEGVFNQYDSLYLYYTSVTSKEKCFYKSISIPIDMEVYTLTFGSNNINDIDSEINRRFEKSFRFLGNFMNY